MKKVLLPLLVVCFAYLSLTAQQRSSNPFIKVYFNTPVDVSVSSGTNAVYLNQTMPDTLAAYINRAQHTIDVAVYDIQSSTAINTVVTAINNAYSRGVKIRWIYDGSYTSTALSQLNSGINTLARPVGNGIMHFKFMVVDANSPTATDAIVWTGSPDWSSTQFKSAPNNVLIFQDQPLAQHYRAEFNQMWGDTGITPNAGNSKWGPAKADITPHTFVIGGTSVECYFSASDSTDAHLLNAISTANSQLYFGMYTFTNSSYANAIAAKFQTSGISVAGIMDTFSKGGTAYNILNPVMGSALKIFTNASYPYHNKYMVVDPCNTGSDPIVETGSMNWSVAAATENDEDELIIHDATIANQYYQAFYQNYLNLGGGLTACSVSNPCTGFSVTETVTNAVCGGNNGTATATTTGGTSPYTYTWSNNGSTNTINNLSAGTYKVTVTDNNQCTATATGTVNSQSGALTLSTSSIAASCGNSNGSASVQVTAGTGPFTYAWSNSGTANTITGLSAGTYTVTVSANGCSATNSVTVTASNGPSVTVNITNAGCSNNNGTATAIVSGGSLPYLYYWSDSANTGSISNLQAGSYAVTVTDNNNCTATATGIVTQQAGNINITVNVTNTTCGNSNGSATLAVTGGTLPYTYLWSNGGVSSIDSNFAAGQHAVTVTDATGCTATKSFTISNSGVGGATITLNVTNTTCGNSNGTASVNVVGGNGLIFIFWSTGATASSLSNLASGNYDITLSDGNNCNVVKTFSIQPSLPASKPTITLTPEGICGNDTVLVCSGSVYATYAWSNGATTACVNATSSGQFSVSITDGNGCSASSTPVTVVSHPLPTANIMVQGSTLTASGGGTSYQWYYNGRTISGAVSSTYVASDSGDYSVEVTDANNCSNKSSIIHFQATGIDEASISTINVYPNPSDADGWQLSVGSQWLGSKCELVDQNGRILFTNFIKDIDTKINGQVAKGIYYLRISNNEVVLVKKLVQL